MIVIVDYGLGNILNVQRAVQHLGYDVVVSRDPAVIERAEQLILPGSVILKTRCKLLTVMNWRHY